MTISFSWCFFNYFRVSRGNHAEDDTAVQFLLNGCIKFYTLLSGRIFSPFFNNNTNGVEKMGITTLRLSFYVKNRTTTSCWVFSRHEETKKLCRKLDHLSTLSFSAYLRVKTRKFMLKRSTQPLWLCLPNSFIVVRISQAFVGFGEKLRDVGGKILFDIA